MPVMGFITIINDCDNPLHQSGSAMKRYLIYLSVFIPLAFISSRLGWNPVLTFAFSAIGIIPMADLIGTATEELAVHTGPTLGGLLNATLGNAAELIITILALREGLYELVLASITGSILGNLLLVLGLSLLLGGLKNGVQSFDRHISSMNATLLILCVVALFIPSIFSLSIAPDVIAELRFSEGISAVMILLYVLTIIYTMTAKQKTYTHEPIVHEHTWPLWKSGLVLLVSTIGVVVASELLVGAVENVTETLGLTEFFLGIIIVPIVGNIAEHLVAVEVAMKNNMDLSLSISLGSSIQIALFVAPLLVFISLFFAGPLLLIFTVFELIALISAALVAALIALDGESNWLEGAVLLAVYLIIALAFYFLPAG